uniref:Uncharacterized protein n=1 Tax=Ditylenchus dipsaci TaxID=166011 RepID=A0A915E644_9BILA
MSRPYFPKLSRRDSSSDDEIRRGNVPFEKVKQASSDVGQWSRQAAKRIYKAARSRYVNAQPADSLRKTTENAELEEATEHPKPAPQSQSDEESEFVDKLSRPLRKVMIRLKAPKVLTANIVFTPWIL